MMRKTPLKSSGFKPRVKPLSGILRTANLPAKAVKPKMRKCAICRTPFAQRSMTHKACSPDCAKAVVERDKKKAAENAARVDRTITRARKEAIKTIPELKAEAQIACNAFIRYRDRDQPCICCNSMPKTSGALSGGSWDACHYRGRGAADHLRYNEDNIHRGLKDCNTYGHKDYRGGLINRIGLERVEALESNHAVVKWTAEMLREIRDNFRAKLKALQAEHHQETAA